jgi:hypothetical protein
VEVGVAKTQGTGLRWDEQRVRRGGGGGGGGGGGEQEDQVG